MNNVWTDEMTRLLLEWWPDISISTAEIGRRLNVTKNSVCGKVDRMGLPSRPSPIKNCVNVRHAKRSVRNAQRAAELAARAAMPAVPAPVPAPAPVKPAFVAPVVVAQRSPRSARHFGDETCCWLLDKRLTCDAAVVSPRLVRTPYCLTHLRASVADKGKYSDEALRLLAARSDRAVSRAVISQDHDGNPA